jgi:hypothetical protein
MSGRMNQSSKDLEVYDCCAGLAVVILFMIALGFGWAGTETIALQMIGFSLAIGLIAIIILLFRIEKNSRPLPSNGR